jgi:hypothetical protein
MVEDLIREDPELARTALIKEEDNDVTTSEEDSSDSEYENSEVVENIQYESFV